MAKPKTRAIVEYNGIERLLFSIRENGDQSLTVVLKDSPIFADRGKLAILHHKISIHVSPSSPGTTLARTLSLSDGTTRKSAQFIMDSKTSLFCVVYGTLCSDLGDKHFDATSRLRDRVVKVGAFRKADLTTLIYHVVVSDRNRSMPAAAGHSVSTIEFSRWNIGIYSTYLNFPASNFRRSYAPATNPETVDGIEVKDGGLVSSDGVESILAEDLPAMLLDMNERLTVGVLQKLSAFASPDQRAQLGNFPLWYHPDTDSLLAGRLGAMPGSKITIPS